MSGRKERQQRRLAEEEAAIQKLRIHSDDPAEQAVMDQVYEAFRGVGREGGMSWREADLIDDYGMGPGRFVGVDPLRWEELVGDPRWFGHWCYGYLDPKGFRFYVPAGMVRTLGGKHDSVPDYILTEDSRYTPDAARLDRWDILSNDQILSIGAYLRHYEMDDKAAAWDRYLSERS